MKKKFSLLSVIVIGLLCFTCRTALALSIEEQIRNTYTQLTRLNGDVAGGFPTMKLHGRSKKIWMAAVQLNGNECSLQTPTKAALGNAPRANVAKMFQQAYNYAEREWCKKSKLLNGHAVVGAFPNFNEASGLYGVVLLSNKAASYHIIRADDLGNPAGVQERFLAVDDWALNHGYVGGFPTFHEGKDGQKKLVYGAICITKEGGQRRVIDAHKIGFPKVANLDKRNSSPIVLYPGNPFKANSFPKVREPIYVAEKFRPDGRTPASATCGVTSGGIGYLKAQVQGGARAVLGASRSDTIYLDLESKKMFKETEVCYGVGYGHSGGKGAIGGSVDGNLSWCKKDCVIVYEPPKKKKTVEPKRPRRTEKPDPGPIYDDRPRPDAGPPTRTPAVIGPPTVLE